MKVMLVDDSSTTAKQLGQIIAQLPGYEVIGNARNGAEAVRMYQELTPDVVFMDLVMPLMDGLQATRAILQHDKNANVIVVSSVGAVGEKAIEALRFGAKSIISKPFELEQIRNALVAIK